MYGYLSKHLAWRSLLAVAGLGLGLGVGMPGMAASGTSASDSAITARVIDGLTHQASLKDANINVKTVNGVVTLTGTVSDFRAKADASTVGIETAGVKVLDNELKTAPPQQKSTDSLSGKSAAPRSVRDDKITADVRQVLADSLSSRYQVDVKTVDGVVYLKGDVKSQHAIDRISSLVAQVEGVKRVNTTGLDYPYVVFDY